LSYSFPPLAIEASSSAQAGDVEMLTVPATNAKAIASDMPEVRNIDNVLRMVISLPLFPNVMTRITTVLFVPKMDTKVIIGVMLSDTG